MHIWRQMQTRSPQRTCFSFFIPKKCYNEPFEFLLCETHSSIFPCVGTVIDVTKYVTACEDGTTITPLDFVLCRTFFVFTSCDITQKSHVRILFVRIIARPRKNLLVIERRNVQVI